MFRMVMIPLLVVAGACSGAVDPNVQVIAENIMSEEDISEADARCIGEYTVENLSPDNLKSFLSFLEKKETKRPNDPLEQLELYVDELEGLEIAMEVFPTVMAGYGSCGVDLPDQS
ncbi:MAG: hypothetical protein CMM12_10995 [Rhodospirillaceae bacterium]|jgi:hypothetical protein|nr:hypothetical protein [Rhodospirillaceae bacterium]HCW78498.1 hypothetical protein [Gemmatimonadota bacterium]|tara:strand:- start:278 stop:625 length:348 start_codon:yes stop_codon:yes gene_type:complete